MAIKPCGAQTARRELTFSPSSCVLLRPLEMLL